MTTREICYETMINVGGGIFLGTKGPMILFTGRRNDDQILSIHPDDLSAEAVRRAIAARNSDDIVEVEQVLVG